MQEPDFEFALLDAATAGDLPAIQRLLAAGASPNSRDILGGYTALHNAAIAGHLAAVQLLVDAGANISDRQNEVSISALASAVVAGRTEIVAYLLQKGADPTECLYPDNTPLINEARDQGDLRIVELLQGSM